MARRSKQRLSRLASGARRAADRLGDEVGQVRGPSPNPMTNLILADVALRGGGSLLRQGVERLLLGARYSPEAAEKIVKGRTLAQTLIGTAVSRIAMRSVPGAILVGGALVAKTLYDRSRDHAEARAEGEKDVAEQADNAR